MIAIEKKTINNIDRKRRQIMYRGNVGIGPGRIETIKAKIKKCVKGSKKVAVCQ